MSIVRLELSQLRNISSLVLDAHPQLNIIAGANGSGKTSLLEGIYLLGRGRSFRTNKRSSLIKENQDCCQLFTRLANNEQSTDQLGIEICPRSRRIRLNGEDIQKSADLARFLPLQFLNQQSFALVDQGPAVRRKFLDWGVFHVEPGFFSAWQHYQRALQQRNAALRQGNTDTRAWDKELANTALPLHSMRKQYVDALNQAFLLRINELLPEMPISIDYLPGWDDGQPILSIFEKDRHKDGRRGFTHSGPHRADLCFMLEKSPAIERLSRGQQKLLVSALTLAQADIYATSTSKRCVILADDLTAELDNRHTGVLLNALMKTGAQVFLTVTNEALLGDLLDIPHALFHVEQGDLKLVEVL